MEGLWQGLKVFEREDIDPAKWAVTSMSGIKRSGKSRGAVLGHRFGIGSDVLLGSRSHGMLSLVSEAWPLSSSAILAFSICHPAL